MKRKVFGHRTLPLGVMMLVTGRGSIGCPERMRQRREIERARKAALKNSDAESLVPFEHNVGYRVLSFGHEGWGGQQRKIDLAVWYPTDKAMKPHTYIYGRNPVKTELALHAPLIRGKFPLVICSHAATGTGLSMTFLSERLASQGYVVVGVDYPDKYYGARIAGRLDWKLGEWKRQLDWIHEIREYQLNKGGKAYRRSKLAYRPRAAKASIDLMLKQNSDKSSPFCGRIDPDRIGLVGHSFGAWTSLLVAGADPLFYDCRVKAVVALSSPCNENVYEPDELGRIRVPVMFMYGSEEAKVGRASDKELLYDRANPPKFLLEIQGADHFAFSGGIRKEYPNTQQYVKDDPRRAAVVVYTMAFLDFYLKNDPAAQKRLTTRTDSVLSFLRDWGHATPLTAEGKAP